MRRPRPCCSGRPAGGPTTPCCSRSWPTPCKPRATPRAGPGGRPASRGRPAAARPMRRLLVALILALLPVATLAQGLGQAAAQERERREKKAREGKEAPAPRTYTDDDLKSPEEREK